MPELPEVETARRGIAPHLEGRTIREVIVRQRQLRWPVPPHLETTLAGAAVGNADRRGKYLLIRVTPGTLIVHLGMSGSLRVLPAATPPGPHDHVDVVLDNGRCLRLRDPRRFGAMLFTRDDPLAHPLLKYLGPEPLSDAFDGAYLYKVSRDRRVAIKNLLMNSRIVAGVGNIYANEALFAACIHPLRAAGRIGRARCDELAKSVKVVLTAAIAAGGTTLRDFTRDDGSPGYFRIELQVYDHAGEPCPRCGTPIKRVVSGQRATYYCPHCQR
ncbi:MAG TPA: bifunctional DNA-formamidopyrimidine glycosylase/DNA-(apurinic or apyrimidinic site) lyase [Gammaproteobacteria bacterium]|nr:bifunctional DNA-formamidopyrimidine glycosylase/DNA-(apurinic or apyrimidinic site) lyase [Gammaproteobacteria bacterium]